ncbi:MAG TPA: hypothetical protein VN828_15725 [Acidobacteriaceae bacterium]|nr:hypothetical protein [Acidobacteriaceae bacterium]
MTDISHEVFNRAMIKQIREDAIRSIEMLQKYENCAAGYFEYPGGIIAFGSREAVRQLVEDNDE